MLEHAQLEWSSAQALLPPFIKSSSGDDESICFIAPAMGVHLFFSVIELLIGFYQIHSCLILAFSTQHLSTCACDENDGLILCLSSFHKVMTTLNVMCSSN
jgi:hypothetical protein